MPATAVYTARAGTTALAQNATEQGVTDGVTLDDRLGAWCVPPAK